MTGLVDASQHRSGRQAWFSRAVTALVLLVLVGIIAGAALHLSRGGTAPVRQVAKIALLPDTPPPPPPPPPEKPRIEPKNEIKQQIDKPKLQAPPEPQILKMEGQAGEGPSPFASGEVKNDYIGGDIGNGNGERYAAYIGRVAEILQEALAKRNLKIANARVFLWLQPDGSVQRYEISGASGDIERQLRTAMSQLGRLPEAPPQDMPMPMGLEISGR
jgi:periplasmic protein TonB